MCGLQIFLLAEQTSSRDKNFDGLQMFAEPSLRVHVNTDVDAVWCISVSDVMKPVKFQLINSFECEFECECRFIGL